MRGIRWGQVEPHVSVPPPIPVDEPMSADRPPADYEDGPPLTHIRVTMPDRPGGQPRSEYVARPGLAREVLVQRALPLLARARYVLDEIADPQHGAPAPVWARDRAARMADAIAGLIGHSTTDAPPAAELEAVLAEGIPAPMPETPAEKAARYERINEALDRMGITVIPPCPMAPYEQTEWEREREAAVPFMGESSEPATRAPHGGRPVVCDGSMVHSFHPDLLHRVRMGFDLAGHPPNCPARQEPDVQAVRAVIDERDKLREPATPVEETPEVRAARLDRERDDAHRVARAATYAADEAWRAIGGRQ